MSGIISKISGSGNDSMIEIPTQYRPSTVRYIPAILQLGLDLSVKPCTVLVRADGIVRVITDVALSLNDRVYFDGCSYFTF
jgi:hypothetical protein